MLDENTTDLLNPVALRYLRTSCRKGAPWLFGSLAILVQLLFFWNTHISAGSPEESVEPQEAIALLMVLTLTAMLLAGGMIPQMAFRERNVDGMDPSMGTCLTAGRILAGQVLAMFVVQGIVLLAFLPSLAYAFLHLNQHRISAELLFCGLGGLQAVLFLLLAIAQATGDRIKRFSALWIPALCLIIPATILSFSFVVLSLDADANRNLPDFFLLLGVLIESSVIALSCAFILGANRPRVRDATTPLHRTALALWILWMPLLPLFDDAAQHDCTYMDGWCVLSLLYTIFLLSLAAIEPLRPARNLSDDLRKALDAPGKWYRVLLHGGVIPGYLLALLVILLTHAVLAAYAISTESSMNQERETLIFVQCYALFYSSVILFLRKTFRFSAGMANLILGIFVLLVALFDTSPLFLNHKPVGFLTGLLTGRAFVCYSDDGVKYISFWILLVPLLGLALWHTAIFRPLLRQVKGEELRP